MKNQKLLICLVKKVSVLYFVTVMGAVCAMDLPDGLVLWYDGLSPEKKQELQNNVSEHNIKRKNLEHAFARDVLDGRALLSFKNAVCNDQKVWDESNKIWRLCDVDTIVELLPDIIVVDRWLQVLPKSSGPISTRKELESLDKLSNIFQEIRQVYGTQYYFRAPYTWANFLKHQGKSLLINAPIFLAPFASQLIRSCCEKGIRQDLVDNNSAYKIMNHALTKAYEKTGGSFLLSHIKDIVDPYTYSSENCFDIKLPYLAVYIGMLGIKELIDSNNVIAATKREDRHTLWEFPTLAVVYGIISLAMEKVCCACLPKLSTIFENHLLTMGCVAGGYALVCSLYSVRQMQSVQEGYVELRNISKLLKRTDIVIE